MMRNGSILLTMVVLVILPDQVKAGITLGTAGDFSILASSTVTNTGSSLINGGDIGVSSGPTITGFLPGSLAAPYTFDTQDALTTQAHDDLTTAYNVAAALAPSQVMTGQDLGGLTLTPGVYFFASSAELTGTLTLNDLGDPNAQFVFQIGSTLTTASNSSVITINDGSVPGNNVYWQIGSSATIGTGTGFEGNLLAFTSITLNSSATILDGRALAMNGSVTLDTNLISATSVPEPSTAMLVLMGGVLVGLTPLHRRIRERRRGHGG